MSKKILMTVTFLIVVNSLFPQKKIAFVNLDEVQELSSFEFDGKVIKPKENERLIHLNLILGIEVKDGPNYKSIPAVKSLKIPMSQMSIVNRPENGTPVTKVTPLLMFHQETKRRYRKDIFKLRWGETDYGINKYITLIFSYPKDKYPVRFSLLNEDYSFFNDFITNELSYPVNEEKPIDLYPYKKEGKSFIKYIYALKGERWKIIDYTLLSKKLINEEIRTIKWVDDLGRGAILDKSYYDNGNLRWVLNYKANFLEGISTYYHNNGKKSKELRFRDNKLVEIIGEWDENGKKIN